MDAITSEDPSNARVASRKDNNLFVFGASPPSPAASRTRRNQEEHQSQARRMLVQYTPSSYQVQVSSPQQITGGTQDMMQSLPKIATRRHAFKDFLRGGVLDAQNIDVSLENFPYLLSATTKDVLIASMSVHMKGVSKFEKYASDLSTMSPRILLSGPAGSEIYQEMLAKALAKSFGAKLMIVDSNLLPGGSPAKEVGSSKEGSRLGSLSMLAKTSVQTAQALQHKTPTSSVDSDITGHSTLSFQALPKQEVSTASYTFKSGDRVKFVGPSSSAISSLQGSIRGPAIGYQGKVVLESEDNCSSKIGTRFDRSVTDGNDLGGLCKDDHGFLCAASSLRLDGSSSDDADKLAINAIFEVAISESEGGSLILFLKDIEKYLVGDSYVYATLKSKLENLPENIVIMASQTQLDSLKEKSHHGGYLFTKFGSNQAVLLDFAFPDNFGKLHDRSKETPKSMKEITQLFPNKVTIQLPQDETLVLDWKEKLDRDTELFKVLTKNRLDRPDLRLDLNAGYSGLDPLQEASGGNIPSSRYEAGEHSSLDTRASISRMLDEQRLVNTSGESVFDAEKSNAAKASREKPFPQPSDKAVWYVIVPPGRSVCVDPGEGNLVRITNVSFLNKVCAEYQPYLGSDSKSCFGDKRAADCRVFLCTNINRTRHEFAIGSINSISQPQLCPNISTVLGKKFILSHDGYASVRVNGYAIGNAFHRPELTSEKILELERNRESNQVNWPLCLELTAKVMSMLDTVQVAKAECVSKIFSNAGHLPISYRNVNLKNHKSAVDGTALMCMRRAHGQLISLALGCVSLSFSAEQHENNIRYTTNVLEPLQSIGTYLTKLKLLRTHYIRPKHMPSLFACCSMVTDIEIHNLQGFSPNQMLQMVANHCTQLERLAYTRHEDASDTKEVDEITLEAFLRSCKSVKHISVDGVLLLDSQLLRMLQRLERLTSLHISYSEGFTGSFLVSSLIEPIKVNDLVLVACKNLEEEDEVDKFFMEICGRRDCFPNLKKLIVKGLIGGPLLGLICAPKLGRARPEMEIEIGFEPARVEEFDEAAFGLYLLDTLMHEDSEDDEII